MLSMKKCLKDILVFGSLKNHKQYIVKSITVPCRIAFYELYICFVYFPFKKHGKDTLYSQNLEQCFIYINIVIYMCIYISTHTHQIETNRKNPNLIIFPRMSFLVIFTYYTLRNPRPTYSSLHDPTFVMPLCYILCLDSFPRPPSCQAEDSIQPKDQLKVTPGKLSCSFLCAPIAHYLSISASHTALQLLAFKSIPSSRMCVSLSQDMGLLHLYIPHTA